ncbi:MAG: glutamate--cysteine ligase [Nocardioidaceae bacterium]
MALRKIGVEEELMLVDSDSGQLRAVSHRALAAHREQVGAAADDSEEFGAEAGLEQELFLQQIETGTTPCTSVAELIADVRRCRQSAAESAEAIDVALIAVGAPVLAGGAEHVTPKPRYQKIVEEFGAISREGSVCGMHVHVDVSGDDEAVMVIDGLRRWLPVLRALSVNSPFFQGEDSGYASWRSQVWGRWPSAGPADPFVDIAGYRAATEALVATGAALDRGMLYLDARLSESYPTVEIRVFDATTEIDDTALVAALTRALVQTTADSSQDSQHSVPRTDLLRAAHWRASRYGLSDQLVDPISQELRPARAVVEQTITFAEDALHAAGDVDLVRDHFERLMARGTGAARQRTVAEAKGGLEAVVDDLRERFQASLQSP